METMSTDFSTEFQILSVYHKNRLLRLSTKPQDTIVFQSWTPREQPRLCGPTPPRTRVPACAKPDAFAQVADKLSDIVDGVPRDQDQVVTECGSDVVQRLVELLKEYGDQVNEKIQNDEELLRYLQGFSYKLFAGLASAFIHRMLPQSKQKEENNDQKIKIAWTFEMISRLSALDLQPMNRAMGFGAQYVHQHFAPWIQQHGGWENAFKLNEGDEVQ